MNYGTQLVNRSSLSWVRPFNSIAQRHSAWQRSQSDSTSSGGALWPWPSTLWDHEWRDPRSWQGGSHFTGSNVVGGCRSVVWEVTWRRRGFRGSCCCFGCWTGVGMVHPEDSVVYLQFFSSNMGPYTGLPLQTRCFLLWIPTSPLKNNLCQGHFHLWSLRFGKIPRRQRIVDGWRKNLEDRRRWQIVRGAELMKGLQEIKFRE